MTNEEKMLDILAGMQSSMLEMRETMDARFERVENAVLKTNIKIEADLEVKIDALAEGHAAILEQLTPRSRIDDIETELVFLKRLIASMSEEIDKLKAV